MKLSRTLPLTALLLGLSLPALAWAQGFEGTITTRTITVSEYALSELLDPDDYEGEEIDPHKVFAIPLERIIQMASSGDDVSIDNLVYSIKGTRLRVDGDEDSEMPGYAILDFGAGTFQIVQPAERMYLEMTREDFEEMQSMFPAMEEEEAAAGMQVRALNQSKEINGMSCSAYELKSEESTSVAWVTDELKDLVNVFTEFQSRMKSMGMFEEEDQDETFLLVAEHGFPILEQTLTTYGMYGGMEYEISEVLSLERKSLQASLFVPPSDYERKSFMDVMRMFGGER